MLKTDLNFQHKLELLKFLKTAFESLLFDRGSYSFGYFKFNGNYGLFCECIERILTDGIMISYDQSESEVFWKYVVSVLYDVSEDQNTPAITEFVRIYKSLIKGESNQILLDWICISLRNKTFLEQFNYLFRFPENLRKCYQKFAFILDDQFLNDFIVCIQAYENNDSKLLNNCKIDLINSSKIHTGLKNNSVNLSIRQTELSHSHLETNLKREFQNKHRRINSYPIMQIKSNNSDIYNMSNISSDQNHDLINKNQNCFNESIENSNAFDKSLDQNNEVNVFDFINQLHVHTECSPLDRENSHFLMADVVITCNELIKSNNLLLEKTNKVSSPIHIHKNTCKNLESKFSRSRSLSKSTDFRKSFSKRSISCSELFSINDSQIAEIITKFKGLKVNESVKSAQSDFLNINSSISDSKMLDSISYTPNFTNYSTSFEESNNITQEGFDLVKNESNRKRKFSWETKDNLDSASLIAFNILKSSLESTKLKAPSLKLFDYFLQSLEYHELVRDYILTSISLKKIKKELTDSLSASSIYLSHNEVNSNNKQITGISPDTYVFINSENNLSSFSKIKDIALNTLKLKNENELDNYSLISSKIIGDDFWAPVREQLIIKRATKIARNDLIRIQNYRCAGCGLKIKDNITQLKSFNYCEYFCKYFCRYCHIKEMSYIPAEVIFSLNFKKDFPVCRKAKNFLISIFKEPLFSLENLNPSLFQGKYSLFSKVKILRIKLYISGQYISTCRYADKIKNEIETKFQNEKFIFENTEVYSFFLIIKIKKYDFIEELARLSSRIIDHIKTCRLCSQRSHICEICKKNDLIFPFDIESVEKCSNCFSCYHKKCTNKIDQCPKCIRLKTRANK